MKPRTNASSAYKKAREHLNTNRQVLREAKLGSRKALKQCLQASCGLVKILETDDSSRRRFLKSTGSSEKNLYLAVVVYATDANTKKRRKLASKHAIAIRYVREVLKIPVSHIARELDKTGGIERVAKLARRHKQRSQGSRGQKAKKRSSNLSPVAITKPGLSWKIPPTLEKKVRLLPADAKFKVLAIRHVRSDGSSIIRISKVVKLKRKDTVKNEDANEW